MKDAFILVVVSIVFLACTGPATAQEIKLIPELKPYEHILGTWKGEWEVRENPRSPWFEASSSVNIRSGGFFVEIRGTVDLGDGEVTSWIDIIGFDPIQRGCVSSSFTSAGGRSVGTSQGWDGTTLTVNFTRFTPDRKVQVRRRTWEYSPDFKSVTLTCEVFTDGKWRVAVSGKSTKVD